MGTETESRRKGLQISLHNTDIEAYFDPKWTGEAICNVIDNAIKYTEHGEICVSAISYEMFVRIDIADTGCGIREEELPKIFMRFYRSELVKDEEGVGIGLYLTREILQEQGGYIKVTSVYGQEVSFPFICLKIILKKYINYTGIAEICFKIVNGILSIL